MDLSVNSFAYSIILFTLGMMVYQSLNMFVQYAFTRDMAFFYYGLSLVFGTYICFTEISQENMLFLFKSGNTFLLSITSVPFLLYWLFFRHLFKVKSDDRITNNMILFAVVFYFCLIILDVCFSIFKPEWVASLIQVTTYILYGPLLLSFWFYYRMYHLYDKKLAIFIMITASIGDFAVLPVQYYFSQDENTSFPFFTVSYLFELLAITIAMTYREQMIIKKNIQLAYEVRDARFDAVSARMSPHFIYNVINAINKLILNRENDTASHYLVKFSRMMRDILNFSTESEISLTKELEAIEKYVSMEMLRFNGDFNFIFQVDSKINTDNIFLPPFILQPFVENSIIHGLIPKNGLKTLEICVRLNGITLEIIVKDNGVGISSNFVGTKQQNRQQHGIDLVKSRLHYYKNGNTAWIDSIQSDENGTEVTLLVKK